MTAELPPPLYTYSTENHAAWVVALSAVFLVYSTLSVAAKVFIRFRLLGWQSYDYVLIMGTVLLIIQTILVIVACNNGLGQHIESITEDALIRYNKLDYTAQLLSILVAGCAKLSTCLLVNAINSFEGKVLLASRALLGTIICWIVSGMLFTAFQCPISIPWTAINDTTCPQRESMVLFNTTMNVLTDLALCILPVALMWNVHTTHIKKFQIIALFGSRIVVPLTTIPVLLATHQTIHSIDAPWDAAIPTTWLQISLNLSIITACIPSLKPILDSLLGQTLGASIQAPYQLANREDGTGLRATALDLDSQLSWFEARMHEPCQYRQATSGAAGEARGNPWLCEGRWSTRRDGKSAPLDCSESTRNLTDGRSMRTDQLDGVSQKSGHGDNEN